MHTLKTVMDHTPITRPDHLPADLEIPVLEGVQAQGDVVVLPRTAASKANTSIRRDAEWHSLPTDGLPVVRGEAGGNTHLLVADPLSVSYTTDLTDRTGLALCAIRVETEAWLLHPEHGANGIAAGTYIIRRQREMTAAGWRQVTD